ncbi:MAG: hypothetical protein GY725_04260 [bacterium]|nr:hypothetical protein [bacterium]
MPGMAERYHELAPGAYLTLMSMIEAIALENLVSRGQEIGAASNFGAESVAVWLAWLLTLQVIIWTWVTNAQGDIQRCFPSEAVGQSVT